MARRVMTALAVAAFVAAPAAHVQRPPGGPTRIVLLVDSSLNVSPMLTPFRAGLLAFLEALPGDPEIALISSGGQLRIRAAPTSDRQALRAAASVFASDGGGNVLLDTLLEADRRFLKAAPDRRSVLVILTSDNGASTVEVRTDAYNAFAADFVRRGGRAHALVVRGVASGITTQIAENLTQNTGGFFEMVNAPTAVPGMMKKMADVVAADL